MYSLPCCCNAVQSFQLRHILQYRLIATHMLTVGVVDIGMSNQVNKLRAEARTTQRCQKRRLSWLAGLEEWGRGVHTHPGYGQPVRGLQGWHRLHSQASGKLCFGSYVCVYVPHTCLPMLVLPLFVCISFLKEKTDSYRFYEKGDEQMRYEHHTHTHTHTHTPLPPPEAAPNLPWVPLSSLAAEAPLLQHVPALFAELDDHLWPALQLSARG